MLPFPKAGLEKTNPTTEPENATPSDTLNIATISKVNSQTESLQKASSLTSLKEKSLQQVEAQLNLTDRPLNSRVSPPPPRVPHFSNHLPPLDFDNPGSAQRGMSTVKKFHLYNWIDASTSMEMAEWRHKAVQQIISCHNNTLPVLDLTHLQLDELPPVIPSHITELNLSGNHLTSLPPFPTTVKCLVLSHNNLTSLPMEALQNIEFLDCSHNPLESFPEKMGSVTHLSFHDTPITTKLCVQFRQYNKNYPKLSMLSVHNREEFIKASVQERVTPAAASPSKGKPAEVNTQDIEMRLQALRSEKRVSESGIQKKEENDRTKSADKKQAGPVSL